MLSKLLPHICIFFCPWQVSVLADDILKNVEYDALRVVYNKFHSVVSFLPTMATVLSPEVIQNAACGSCHFFFMFCAYGFSILCNNLLMQAAEKEAESGGKLGELDSYEIEGDDAKSAVLQNLAEFQFSCVSLAEFFNITGQ